MALSDGSSRRNVLATSEMGSLLYLLAKPDRSHFGTKRTASR